MNNCTVTEIIDHLISQQCLKYRSNVAKLGIPEEKCIGVSTSYLRKYARSIPKDAIVANALWDSGYHEAKLLAVLLFDTKTVTLEMLKGMVQDVYSWDVCDHFCKELVYKSEHYNACILNWVDCSKTYVKRAAFVLMCTDVIRNETLSSQVIDEYLEYCIHYATCDAIHIRKAISWVMREIGKINIEYRDKIVKVCDEMSLSGTKNEIWIAKDVLCEVQNLVSVSGRKRLVSHTSKMAQTELG